MKVGDIVLVPCRVLSTGQLWGGGTVLDLVVESTYRESDSADGVRSEVKFSELADYVLTMKGRT